MKSWSTKVKHSNSYFLKFSRELFGLHSPLYFGLLLNKGRAEVKYEAFLNDKGDKRDF